MTRTYQVISADGHIETPPDVWLKYVPEKWRDRAPRLVKLPDGGEGWVVENRPLGVAVSTPIAAHLRPKGGPMTVVVEGAAEQIIALEPPAPGTSNPRLLWRRPGRKSTR